MTYNFTNAPVAPVRDKWMDRQVREVLATGGTYATGGEPIDAASLGLGTIFGVYGTISNGTAVLIGNFDQANQKQKWFVPNTGAEVANATDLAGYTGVLLITGK